MQCWDVEANVGTHTTVQLLVRLRGNCLSVLKLTRAFAVFSQVKQSWFVKSINLFVSAKSSTYPRGSARATVWCTRCFQGKPVLLVAIQHIILNYRDVYEFSYRNSARTKYTKCRSKRHGFNSGNHNNNNKLYAFCMLRYLLWRNKRNGIDSWGFISG